MAYYIVKFFKKLVDDTGGQFDVCQGTVETTAADHEEAATLAKQQFCEAGHLHDWTIHADRVEVLEAGFSS